MSIEVLDPTWGDGAEPFSAAPALVSLDGATIGIVSNGKKGTRAFFSALGDALVAHGAAAVEVAVKDNYSAPAGPDIIDRAKTWNALVSGIGD